MAVPVQVQYSHSKRSTQYDEMKARNHELEKEHASFKAENEMLETLNNMLEKYSSKSQQKSDQDRLRLEKEKEKLIIEKTTLLEGNFRSDQSKKQTDTEDVSKEVAELMIALANKDEREEELKAQLNGYDHQAAGRNAELETEVEELCQQNKNLEKEMAAAGLNLRTALSLGPASLRGQSLTRLFVVVVVIRCRPLFVVPCLILDSNKIFKT